MQAPLVFVDSLIQNTERKARFLRRWGIAVMLATGLTSALLFTLLVRLSSNAVHPGAMAGISVTGVVALLILGYFSKTLLALSNAYALRCGQMEDIKILLLTQTEGAIPPNDLVAALVAFRRGVLEEMVKASIPENMAADLLRSSFGLAKGSEKKDSKAVAE